jgi:hypothetical protein
MKPAARLELAFWLLVVCGVVAVIYLTRQVVTWIRYWWP